MSDQQTRLETARRDRGAQLRALVVSWQEGKTFLEVLADQQKQIDAGGWAPSDEWGQMAEEILAIYMSIPKMTAWDNTEHEDEGPKLVLP